MLRYFLTYLGIASLILSLVLPSVLNYSLYRWKTKAVKKEVKAMFKIGLDEEQITKFSLDPKSYSNLEWEEEGEFIWEGRKYDVISVELRDGVILMKAWLDDKESELRDQFHKLLKKHSPKNKKSDFSLIDYFKGFLSEVFDFETTTLKVHKHLTDYLIADYDSHIAEWSPPPRH